MAKATSKPAIDMDILADLSRGGLRVKGMGEEGRI